MSAASTMPEAAPLSEGARIIDTFVAPTKTFADINRKATWIVPWLLVTLFSYAMNFAAVQKIGWPQITENQMRLNPKGMEQIESAPPDRKAQALKFSMIFTKAVTFAGPVLGLLFLVIVAGVLHLTFNFGLGADLKFGKSLAVVMYSTLPGIIKCILAIALIYAGVIQPDAFLAQDPIGSNLGALFTRGTPLYALGAQFDLFVFWTLALSAIGFTCIGKVKRGGAF